jgi:hypothetical protein
MIARNSAGKRPADAARAASSFSFSDIQIPFVNVRSAFTQRIEATLGDEAPSSQQTQADYALDKADVNAPGELCWPIALQAT